MKLELISFAICPYVQRSVITLKHKKVPFQITYIDLANPPEWFDKISPLGQVPVLKIDDKTVIFESAVINELIDELNPPSLHPSEPIQKAKERAWIEYGSSLLGDLYELTMERDKKNLPALQEEFFTALARLEENLGAGPFFRGTQFSLLDTAYAPLFMRVFLFDSLRTDPAWKKMPKVRTWGETLVKLPFVQESVLPDFPEKYLTYLRNNGSALLK